MNKIKSLIAAVAVSVMTFPTMASAQWILPGRDDAGNLSNRTFYAVVQSLLFYLLGIIGVLAVVGFVISGIMYITAAGDEDRVDLAKKMLTYSIVGIAVALLGLVIVQALSYVIGGPAA